MFQCTLCTYIRVHNTKQRQLSTTTAVVQLLGAAHLLSDRMSPSGPYGPTLLMHSIWTHGHENVQFVSQTRESFYFPEHYIPILRPRRAVPSVPSPQLPQTVTHPHSCVFPLHYPPPSSSNSIHKNFGSKNPQHNLGRGGWFGKSPPNNFSISLFFWLQSWRDEIKKSGVSVEEMGVCVLRTGSKQFPPPLSKLTPLLDS